MVTEAIFKSTPAGHTFDSVKTDLCFGPHFVDTYSKLNKHWVKTYFYMDDPTVADSVWGEPPLDTLLADPSIVDAIALASLTYCGINFMEGIDTAYVSNYFPLGDN